MTTLRELRKILAFKDTTDFVVMVSKPDSMRDLRERSKTVEPEKVTIVDTVYADGNLYKKITNDFLNFNDDIDFEKIIRHRGGTSKEQGSLVTHLINRDRKSESVYINREGSSYARYVGIPSKK